MFKIGDRVKFKKSSLASGMIDATEEDVFIIENFQDRAKTMVLLEGQYFAIYNVDHLEHVKEETMEEEEIKWEVGQEVWCLVYGKGEVVNILQNVLRYPVVVKFVDGKRHFTEDGKADKEFARTLFFSEPKIIAETMPPKKPFVPTFKQGETVVAKKKDGQDTVVFYVDKETELSVESTGCGYPKALYNFYKIGEEVKFS